MVGQSVAAAAAAAAVAAAAQAAGGGGQGVPTSQADSIVGAATSQQVTTNSVTPKVSSPLLFSTNMSRMLQKNHL